jgi:23S rRNA A1618 N6-methylase RlmF
MYPCCSITCIEVSSLHADVLEAKGYYVERGDFLKWVESTNRRFDRVVCNPPYSQGRWRAHVEAAYSLLSEGGRMAAILPASARNNPPLKGCEASWSSVYSNMFRGASVDVSIMVVVKNKGER